MLVEKWLVVISLLLSSREGDSKIAYGVVSSSGAYQDKGAYITKFCYHSTLSFVFHIAHTHNSYPTRYCHYRRYWKILVQA